MAIKKYLELPSKQRSTLSVDNFLSGFNVSLDSTVLPNGTAREISNFSFGDGALKCGYGVVGEPSFPDGVTNVWLYKKQESGLKYLMASLECGNVVFREKNSDGEFMTLSGAVFTSKPYAVNYRLYSEDVILMLSPTDGMFVWNGEGSAYKIENSPLITSFTLHYERMFATTSDEPTKLWFSDDLDPTNWECSIDSGGFIEMLDGRGKMVRALSFLNYVYVFREFGISRVTAYADQTEFSATNLFVSSGRIYGGSIAECGDSVVFLASDGLHRFDGLSTTRICRFLGSLIAKDQTAPVAAYSEGRYFLALKLSPENGEAESGGNNGLIIYDVKSGDIDIVRGVNAVSLTAAESELYVVTDTSRTGRIEKCGTIFSEPSLKRYRSGESDFNSSDIKTIKEVSVFTDEPFTLILRSERGERSFIVNPSDGGLTRLNPNFMGRRLSFAIETRSESPSISRLKLKITK